MAAVDRTRLPALVAAAWLVACAAPPPPACPDGAVQDLESAECVPEHCGAEPWGVIDRNSSTIHVAPWGDDDGDGSEEAPFATIQRGADEARDGLVAVAAGTYLENLALDEGHRGLSIAGRCLELVVIDGSGVEEEQGIHIYAMDLDLADVTVARGWRGIDVYAVAPGNASITARDVLLDQSEAVGILLTGRSTADLEDVTVRDTQPLPDGTAGTGIHLQGGAGLVGRRLLLERNHNLGLNVGNPGTTAELEDSTIRDTQSRPDGSHGMGVAVFEEGVLVARRLLLDENHSAGLIALDDGTEVVLEDSTVRRTLPRPDGTEGRGLEIQLGARLVARNLLLEENTQYGLYTGEPGTIVELDGAVIRDTVPGIDLLEARGIGVQRGGALVARDVLLEGNYAFGITISGEGTTADLEDVTIIDTLPRVDGLAGRGIDVAPGASLVGRRLQLERNSDVGLFAEGPNTTLDLEDVEIRDTGTWPDGTFGRGVELHDGARLVARRVLLEGNRDAGLMLKDLGTSADLVDVRVVGTRSVTDSAGGVGVAVQDGALLVGADLVIEDNVGPGLYLVNGGTLDAEDVTLAGNAFAGAVVLNGRLALRASTVSGSVGHGSEGGGLGIFGWDLLGPPDVELRDVDFTDLVGPALYPRGPGRYRMLGCTVTNAGSPPVLPGGVLAVEGVQAWQESDEAGELTGLLVEGNSFTGLSGDAIVLDSSSGTLDVHPETGEPNTFVDVEGQDVIWQRCEGTEAPAILDGSAAAPACEASPQMLGPLLEYRLWLGETDPVE